MPNGERWSSSMLQAWQYTLSTVEHGMTPTAGLADYRAGGGSIRTADWYRMSTMARDTYATGAAVTGLPFETPIPQAAHTSVDFDYGQKYVTVADVKYTDWATGQTVRRTVTVEGDVARPWHEIADEISEMVETGTPMGRGTGVSVLRSWFYTPSGASR